jgi:AcrR family transcriptional regulator
VFFHLDFKQLFDTIVSNDCLEHVMRVPDETRQRLIAEAGPLFAERGLRATSVRDIIKPAGANVAAIHYHFGGLDQLYIECVRQAAASCLARVPFPDWPSGTPAAERLRGFIHTFLQRVAVDYEPGWYPRLIMREMADPTPACVQFVRDFVRPNFEVLHGILREMLPAEVSERKLSLCLFSIVGQCLHYRFTRPVIRLLLGEEEFGKLDVETLAGHIFDFSLAAVRSLAARQRRKETP